MTTLHDAEALLREWYCQLQEALRTEDPEESHSRTIYRREDLRILEHCVFEAMSVVLPDGDVSMALIEPTKRRDELDEDRLGKARSRLDDAKPVERSGDGKARVLDGNHRYYAAMDAGLETLRAVWVNT